MPCIIFLLTCFAIFFFFIYYLIYLKPSNRILSHHQILSDAKYAIVLGAGLEKNGFPSKILLDRLLSGIEIYQQQPDIILVVSGGEKYNHINEAMVMREFLLAHNVPSTKIKLDPHGKNTFTSMLNTKKTLNSNSTIIIISQKFHLYRALFLASAFGMDAYGFAASNFSYSTIKRIYWSFREFVSIPLNLFRISIYLYNKHSNIYKNDNHEV